MTIFQSNYANGRRVVPVGDCAGEVIAQKFDFVVATNIVAASDLLEIGCLPAGNTIVDAILLSDELGSTTLSVGLMSGDFGDAASVRTNGAELYSASADASVTRMTLATGFRIDRTDKDRGIGVTFSANVTASNQKIELLLFYRA